jgi:hypothetical protein
MGRRNDHIGGARNDSRSPDRGHGITQARAFKPEFADGEHLEELFLGVDFLNYLALKLLIVALLCLLHIDVA